MEVLKISGSGDKNGLAITGITLDMRLGPLAFMNPDDAPNPPLAARRDAAKKWPGVRVVAEHGQEKRLKTYLQDAIGPGFSFPGCDLAVSDRAREILEPILGSQVAFLDLDVVNAGRKYWAFYPTQYYSNLDPELCELSPPYSSAADRRPMMRKVGFVQSEELEQLNVFRVPSTAAYSVFAPGTFATQKFLDLVMKHQLGGFTFRKNFHKGFRPSPGEQQVIVSNGPKYPLADY